ncbi:hypothetical protein [Agathobaculum sp.]|uniref:hypothetical protein n=1 Tax=Agathobaculum sp. TaxID=2048138 RepID=UPI003AB7E3F3
MTLSQSVPRSPSVSRKKAASVMSASRSRRGSDGRSGESGGVSGAADGVLSAR